MKKITILAFALICSATVTFCAAKKPVKPKVDPQQALIDSLKREQEIRRLKREIAAEEEKEALRDAAEKAQIQADIEIYQMHAANARKAAQIRKGQSLFIPCMEQSYDKTDEYMAGLGIAENEVERGPALTNANRYAIADITSRYIGVIKNGVSQYTKNANTRSGEKIKESELEGMAVAIGEKAVEKYAETVCHEFEEADDGTYTCYVAVHVPLREVINQVVEGQGVLQTDSDREQFRKYMQQELDRQTAAKEAQRQEQE